MLRGSLWLSWMRKFLIIEDFCYGWIWHREIDWFSETGAERVRDDCLDQMGFTIMSKINARGRVINRDGGHTDN